MNVSHSLPFRPATPNVVAMPQREKTRSALVIGINYSGANQLRGCVNDAEDVEKLLTSEFGLKKDRLIRLRDKDATRKAIIDNIIKLAQQPTDYVHFVYSGHGTYVPDTSGEETDKQDEALVPWDYTKGLILDDELWQLWRLFPPTTTIFLHVDACHSATVAKGFSLDSAKEYARKLWRGERARFLPASDVTDVMVRATRIGYEQTKSRVRLVPVARIVSLSGCQDWQTSADARIKGKWCGAMTNYFLEALKTLKKDATWKQLHAEVERLLRVNGYAQIPALVTYNSVNDEALDRKLFT